MVEHLVRFVTAEGRDGHHTADGLDEALRFVERLRNNEDVSEVHVYRLHEVPIEFRAYYKVELRGTGEGGDAAAPAVPAVPAVPVVPPVASPGEDSPVEPAVAGPHLLAGVRDGDIDARDHAGRRLFSRG